MLINFHEPCSMIFKFTIQRLIVSFWKNHLTSNRLLLDKRQFKEFKQSGWGLSFRFAESSSKSLIKGKNLNCPNSSKNEILLWISYEDSKNAKKNEKCCKFQQTEMIIPIPFVFLSPSMFTKKQEYQKNIPQIVFYVIKDNLISI